MMAKDVTPQPMPLTGLPDRVDYRNQPFNMKAGMSSDRPMNINPGKPPSVDGDGK
jgi:hypothetical protein